MCRFNGIQGFWKIPISTCNERAILHDSDDMWFDVEPCFTSSFFSYSVNELCKGTLSQGLKCSWISIMEILNEQFFGFFLNQLSKVTSKVWNVRVYWRYIVVILDMKSQMRFSAFIIDLSPKFWYSTYISMIFLATLARIFTFPLESLNS